MAKNFNTGRGAVKENHVPGSRGRGRARGGAKSTEQKREDVWSNAATTSRTFARRGTTKPSRGVTPASK